MPINGKRSARLSPRKTSQIDRRNFGQAGNRSIGLRNSWSGLRFGDTVCDAASVPSYSFFDQR